MTIELLNIDCMEYMRTLPDNYFDLAIVDPPYGIGENAHRSASRSKAAKTTDWGEFDKNYFSSGKDRLENHQKQIKLL